MSDEDRGEAGTGGGRAGASRARGGERAGALGKAPRIVAGKNRRRQIVPTKRKLFTAGRKAEFLEWFAATCNLSLAARKVGVHYRTVCRHRTEDPAFGAACAAALPIGYERLEALAVRSAEAALKRRRRVRGDRAAPAETLNMTAADALQLLREHKRWLAALEGKAAAKPGRAPTVASNAEVLDSLVARLKAFGVRIGRDGRPK